MSRFRVLLDSPSHKNMAENTVTLIDWKAASDEDLMLYMACQNDGAMHNRNAESAFIEFHLRYKKLIFGMIRQKEAKTFGDDGVETIANNAFVRIYKRAETYKGGSIKGWIGAIVTNIIVDFFRGEKATEIEYDENLHSPEKKESNEKPSALDLAYQQAIESLTEKEKEVIHITNLYMRNERKHQHTPHEVIREVCEKLGITPTYFRKIRERAIRKIKEKILKGGDKHETQRRR